MADIFGGEIGMAGLSKSKGKILLLLLLFLGESLGCKKKLSKLPKDASSVPVLMAALKDED